MKICINGKILDESEAVISVYDHGFLYGMGLFETFRTFQGKPFLLKEHLIRLQESCQQIGLFWEANDRELKQWIDLLLTENQLVDAYFRLSISAGFQPLGLPIEQYHQPNQILYIKPLGQPQHTKAIHTKDLQLLQHRRNTPESSTRLKSFHYMNNVLAKFELQQRAETNDAEGLMLTDQLHLAEGIVSNLFFLKNKILYTPSLDTGILAGITRNCVIQLATHLQLEFKEGRYSWEDLLVADEIFLTNSIHGITPVTQLIDENGSKFPVGSQHIGTYTTLLMKAYERLTERGE